MSFFKRLFSQKHQMSTDPKSKEIRKVQNNEEVAIRKGELGEYKINIQLAQFPSNYLYISDLMIKNEKSNTGYSQIDHIIITPYCIFVIETKNYQGTIYGGENRNNWLINGKFKMMNPLRQNYGHIQALSKFVTKKDQSIFVNLICFTKRCTVKVEPELRKISSNKLVVYDVELTEFINRKVSVIKLQHKKPLLDENEVAIIYSKIQAANLTDVKIRESHIASVKQIAETKPS